MFICRLEDLQPQRIVPEQVNIESRTFLVLFPDKEHLQLIVFVQYIDQACHLDTQVP